MNISTVSNSTSQNQQFMRKHLCAVILLAAAMQQSAFGQGFANAKYASEFLSLGAGARSAALGGAGTGFADDVTAGYVNPAALSLVNYPQIAIFHESRFGG
ncbi:MAG: UPF0164 family protein, partial [Gemmatimonadetes bacterium]|nr:UPF0164 family protein [Gemmatimonadota bacterium]